jgi:hypothetical protein
VFFTPTVALTAKASSTSYKLAWLMFIDYLPEMFSQSYPTIGQGN